MSYHFQCVDCGKSYEASQVKYVCPLCAPAQKPMEPTRGVLKTIFDYDSIRKRFTKKTLQNSGDDGMSRYIDLLPISDPELLPPLKVGMTPLYEVSRLRKEWGLKNLFIKDDTGLPTASFKDRASSLVVAHARELKVDTVTTASTGNAATALAGMCASVGMKSVIFVPASAPAAKLTQIMIYGASIIPVDGTYDDAFELSIQATREFGWYNRNTAYNPFTIEGKKTAALEMWEQLGYKVPDKIFIPTGDGVILAGIYKGFYDLREMGLIEKLPQLIPVQAEGSAAIVKALEAKLPEVVSLKESHTIADSISVSAPRCGRFALKATRETSGFGVTVSDKEIAGMIATLGRLTGIFAEPAAAAAAAGLHKAVNAGLVEKNETVVVMITGNGLKDVPTAQSVVQLPKSIKPNLNALKERCLSI